MKTKKRLDISGWKVPLDNEQIYLLNEYMTDKQTMFGNEYMRDCIATRTAIRVGYPEKDAGTIGHEIRHNELVDLYIQHLLWKRAERCRYTAEKIDMELAKIAFINIQDLYDDKGNLKDVPEFDRADAAAIESITEKKFTTEDNETVTKTIKLSSKKSALELLGRRLGLFKDNIDVTSGNKTLFDVMTAYYEQKEGQKGEK